MSKKFEYKRLVTLREDKDDIIDQLNELGKEGWELVKVEEHATGGYHAWVKKEV